MNTLYRRLKDNMEVVSLFQPGSMSPSKPKNHNMVWLPVRYVKSGRKGYILKIELLNPMLYEDLGEIDLLDIWSSRPPGAPTNAVAAAEEDIREREISKRRKKILETVFHGVDTSVNARVHLDQAIHMILAGV